MIKVSIKYIGGKLDIDEDSKNAFSKNDGFEVVAVDGDEYYQHNAMIELENGSSFIDRKDVLKAAEYLPVSSRSSVSSVRSSRVRFGPLVSSRQQQQHKRRWRQWRHSR